MLESCLALFFLWNIYVFSVIVGIMDIHKLIIHYFSFSSSSSILYLLYDKDKFFTVCLMFAYLFMDEKKEEERMNASKCAEWEGEIFVSGGALCVLKKNEVYDLWNAAFRIY